MTELLDIYDENWRPIGKAPRDEVHARGLRHRVVHCWILDEGGTAFWFQQRAHTKRDFPDFYDLACGGHIDAGETPEQAMLRELGEELGLTMRAGELLSLGEYHAPELRLPGYHDREISHVFLLRRDAPSFFPGEEVGRMVRVFAADFYRMEVKGAEIVPAFTQFGERFFVRRADWCCHDGEFQHLVLPYLREAFFHFGSVED